MRRILLVMVIAACGGKAKSTETASNAQPAAPQEQTLKEAVTYLCDAIARTVADPEYRCGLDGNHVCPDDPSDQIKLLGKHVKENQTHPRVLAFLEVDGQKKGDELPKLMAEAGVTSCPLTTYYRPSSPPEK